MIKEWTVEKVINGKRYKIHFIESDYYGGSKMLTSRMELIDGTIENDRQKNIQTN